MRFKEFVAAWKDVIIIIFGTIGIATNIYTFVRSNLYVSDDLQVTAIGDVDQQLPASQRDRIALRLAVANAGTRDAAVLQADIMALYKEENGYSWVRIFPAIGEGFEAKTLKPGEIVIVSLISGGYTRDYYVNGRYSRPIDAQYHEFTEALRVKSMDSQGRIYSTLYPISQFKIRNDWKVGPTEGFTFDRSTHHLLVNGSETMPPLAKEYKDDIP